jgi:GT2 family glycosyltransferase
MQSTIPFSIIIPTWNNLPFLKLCIESIRKNSAAEHQIIIHVNDGSDGTLAWVREQGFDYTYTEQNVGVCLACNMMRTKVATDYILYLNAGDSFPQADTLELVAHRCRLNELPSDELPAVLYGNTDIVDGEGRYLHPRRLQPPAQISWRSFLHGMLVCHQAFYARTDIAKNLQYDTKYKYSADVDWCIRVMRETERMGLTLCNINMVVANYTEEGATTRHHRESLRERYRVMASHYGQFSTFLMHCWFVVRNLF